MPHSGKSYYKTIRCKAYTSNGNLISRACPHGNQCRYLHPEDAKWPGVRFRSISPMRGSDSFKAGNKISKNRASLPSQDYIFSSIPSMDDNAPNRSSSRSSFHRPRTPDSPARHRGLPKRPSSPTRGLGLSKPIQKFSKTTTAWDADDIKRQRAKLPRRSSSRSPLKGAGRAIPTKPWRPPSAVLRRSLSRSPDVDSQERNIASKTFLLKEEAATSAELMPEKRDGIIGLISSEKISGLWRDLAAASRNSFRNVDALKEKEEKVNTCTQIRDLMSKVSKTAESIVTPTLADLIMTRDSMKADVEGGFEAVDDLWKELFDTISSDISGLLERQVQEALESVKVERVAGVDELIRTSSSLSQKRRLDDDRDSRSRYEGDAKRPRRTLEREDSMGSLSEAKRIMREQKERLEALARENAELKSRIDDRVQSQPG